MDIKSRTKQIKEKLKDFGYDVKHTHCQEILAIANGDKNFHVLKSKNRENKKENTVISQNPKSFIVRLGASTTNDYDCSLLEFVYFKPSTELLKKAKELEEFLNKNPSVKEIQIEIDGETKIIPVSVDDFDDVTLITDKEFVESSKVEYDEFEEDSVSGFFKEEYSEFISITKYGIQIKYEITNKIYSVYYYSFAIDLSNF